MKTLGATVYKSYKLIRQPNFKNEQDILNRRYINAQ